MRFVDFLQHGKNYTGLAAREKVIHSHFANACKFKELHAGSKWPFYKPSPLQTFLPSTTSVNTPCASLALAYHTLTQLVVFSSNDSVDRISPSQSSLTSDASLSGVAGCSPHQIKY
jgi:hypothetical protein